MSDPVQAVLSRLQGFKATGDGKWEGRCPAHDDQHASLSISCGEDGRALLHCFAGCTPEAIVGKLGLKMTDLFPDNGRAGQKKSGTAWPSVEAGAAWCAQKEGGRDHLWDEIHVDALKAELRRRGRYRGGDNG